MNPMDMYIHLLCQLTLLTFSIKMGSFCSDRNLNKMMKWTGRTQVRCHYLPSPLDGSIHLQENEPIVLHETGPQRRKCWGPLLLVVILTPYDWPLIIKNAQILHMQC